MISDVNHHVSHLRSFQLISTHDENMNVTMPANMNMVKCAQLLNMEIDEEIYSHKSAMQWQAWPMYVL